MIAKRILSPKGGSGFQRLSGYVLNIAQEPAARSEPQHVCNAVKQLDHMPVLKLRKRNGKLGDNLSGLLQQRLTAWIIVSRQAGEFTCYPVSFYLN